MYKIINQTASIPAKLLYDDLLVISYEALKKQIKRGKIVRTKQGKGMGNEAYVSFESLPEKIKQQVIAAIGNPPKDLHYMEFAQFINKDTAAVEFFETYTYGENQGLPEETKQQYICHAEIFNAIQAYLKFIQGRRTGQGSKVNVWQKLADVLKTLPKHTYPHALPENYRRLQEKYKLYSKEGYACIVHKGYGQKNAERLQEEARGWVLSKWADRVNRCVSYPHLLQLYNAVAPENGWKTLKSEQTLINFLTNPQIEPLWYGYRYGEHKSKEKFMYQHSTIMASMRDSLWYSDGTKLNYFYTDDDGKIKTMQVYEVMDTFSEVFLGYHISKTEDHEAQYYAFKMALQISGQKPYEIKFDNQGGTKKLEAQSFLNKLARLTTRTQPYNGKSKTIESAFGRFQKQFLKKDWFYTGANITAKSLESKINIEQINANKKKLPSLAEIKAAYLKRRKEWNQAPHPKTGKPRLEMYLESNNPQCAPVSMFDMIEMFWIQHPKPVTSTGYGINFKKDKTPYQYIVYDENRLPNVRWMAQNIDKKFVVKYDPDDMSMIQLYEDSHAGLRRVGYAETKIAVHRNKQEQEAWEAELIGHVNSEIKKLRLEQAQTMENIQAQHGMRNEDYGLNKPALLGIESSRKAKAKAKLQLQADEVAVAMESETELVSTEPGEYYKEISNTIHINREIF